MKKLLKRKWLSLLLCATLVFSCCFAACSKEEEAAPQGNGKNLIYVIGDGMGFNHIANTKVYMETEALCFEQYYVGEVMTRSADNLVTDSAAAATALATGVKTNNGYVGIDPEKNTLENLMEISKKEGKKTGIVTTDTLDGATPAGFSAHAEDRDNRYDIMFGQKDGSVDLLIGKYLTNYKSIAEEFEKKGFSYAETLTELEALPKDKKVLANVKNFEPTYGKENADEFVPLKSAVEYALEYLSTNNDDGFTLMVEGAYIDKHSHSNDLLRMIYALMDLNDAVEYILDWASERTDTTVIFTADHETGKLQKAADISSLQNSLYLSGDHSNANVPLYLYNAEAKYTLLENTEVFDIAKEVVVG